MLINPCIDSANHIQLAQPIRLLLKYTGTEFEDVFYEEGPREF